MCSHVNLEGDVSQLLTAIIEKISAYQEELHRSENESFQAQIDDLVQKK